LVGDDECFKNFVVPNSEAARNLPSACSINAASDQQIPPSSLRDSSE